MSEALKKAGYNVDEIQITDELLNPEKIKSEIVFIALHGCFGEDGKIQKFLKIIILFLPDLHPHLVIYPLINFYLEKY